MKSFKYPAFFILSVLILGCSQTKTGKESISWKVKETKDWFKNQGLDNVESVIYDQNQQVLYITNGVDYQPGIDGFISKGSSDGKHLELHWVDSLNRPTGMALKGTTLYVVDVFMLLAIDTESGKIIETYQEPVKGSALNDVGIGPDGEVYVTASRIGAVLKLNDGQLNLWTQDKLMLKYANGLLVREDEILVSGFNLTRIQITNQQLTDWVTKPVIKDLESLISDGKDGYFLTTVSNNSLNHLQANLQSTLLLDGEDYFGDLSFNEEDHILYIPRGNEDTGEFYISVITLKN